MNRRLAEMTVQSFERMQSSAERTGRSLDDAFRAAAGRLQDAGARPDRSRAA